MRCSSCGANEAVWSTCSRRPCPNSALGKAQSFEETVRRVLEAVAERQEGEPVEVKPFPCVNCGDLITEDPKTGRLLHTCRGKYAPRPPARSVATASTQDPLDL